MIAKILTILLGLTLILAVACGSSPAAPEATTPPAVEPTAAPIEGDTSQPTATPQVVAPPAEVEVHPGKVTIMMGDFGNERFDNTFAVGGVGVNIYGRIMGGYLIPTNERTEMMPGIASAWELSDDGLTWTFTIREGVKFHDGSDLTLEDVLWSMQHYFGPQAVEYSISSHSTIISRVMEKIELSGSDKVSLITKEPVTYFPVVVSEAGSTSFHIMPKRAKLHDTEEEVAYDNNPIGAGIMRLVKHVPASSMSFERFDDFYYQPANGFPEDKRVNFQSLDLFLAPEEATRVAALRSGDADIVAASLPTKEQIEAGGGRLVFGQEGAYLWAFMMGCWDIQFPCHDKRVRQALDYAIDKELIRDRLYGGPEVMQVKGWTAATPSTIGYTPALDPWPFDPDKARQLLADAGYPGGEGFGKLIVNTYPANSVPLQVESAQLVAEFWRRELGIDMEVNVGDDTAIGKRWRAQELKGQILWKNNETRVDVATALITVYGNPANDVRLHEDAELFRLTNETFQILDADQRAEATKKLLLRLRDESYELGIGYVNVPWGVGPRVLTWEPYPLAWYPSALHTIILK